MTLSQLARVRAADAERKRQARANRSELQIDRDRQQDTERARARRALMHTGELGELRESNRVCQSIQRDDLSSEQQEQRRRENTAAASVRRSEMTEEHRTRRERMTEQEHQTLRDDNTTARRATRATLTEEEQQTIRARATATWQTMRDAMTEEDIDRRREGEQFRRRSRKYQKGLAYYEEFDPSIIPGGRHYFSRYTDDTLEHERVCQHCGAWKFPDEIEGSCCRKGLVDVPSSREAPAELNRLFGNPRIKQSIRAYNNVFAFTSMGSSRTRSLNVDERVTRSGVYNFRVQSSVCHRMGALLPPPNRRPMFAQVYINDLDIEARVASRMEMTDGLDPVILGKIDQVMTAHNGYTQQFLNARTLLIDRAGPAYQAAVEQFARQLAAGEARPGDNPALRLNEFLPRDEDLRLRLHVARNTNPGTHNVSTASEVAAIIIDRAAAEHRDIILNYCQGGFQRFFKTSKSYDPLQYPLLFPYGEPGWTNDLPYVGDPVGRNGKPLTMSLREYESYVLHDQTASNSLIIRGGRLTQQYCVDQWAKCEQERLRFIEKNQFQYRLETLQGLTDALRNESVDVHRAAAKREWHNVGLRLLHDNHGTQG
ncbi:hypothetical protein P3T76_005706 [Phytophthora citrophthora]|uniref:Helitron helicase-like domain-containing protein n=1 Tax=Phytophthora citrophthora TaxID=4793 RepID=A0AAD9GR70_9STRA|nr:hypothetical protein P3T76_005706 [Phytophthora citrophthora]